MSERRGKDDDEVFSITSAAESQSSSIGAREKRYAIAMGVRTLCFLGAVLFVAGPMKTWPLHTVVAWILVVGAVLLPYTSVILANAGVRRRGRGMDAFDPNRPELEA